MTGMREKIRNIREKTGLSQLKFASEIGVSESTVYRWEIGERSPSKLHVKKICETFDVSTEWLLGEIFDQTTKSELLKTVDISTVGGRIKFLRVENEMSIRKFADEFAVKESTVLNWETGKSKPMGPKAMKVAEKFGVSLSWLLGDCDDDEALQTVDISTVGGRIKFLRKRGKMSHRVFAAAINVSKSMPIRWENDSAAPSKVNLTKIAELFEASIDWLKDGVSLEVGETSAAVVLADEIVASASGVEYADDETNNYLTALFETLSPIRQGKLLGYLDALCNEEISMDRNLVG